MKRTPRSSIPQFNPGFFVVREGPDGPLLRSMFPLRRRTFSPVPGRRVPLPDPPRGILLLPAGKFVVALRGLDRVAPHCMGLWTPPRWGLLRKGSEKEMPAKGGGNDASPSMPTIRACCTAIARSAATSVLPGVVQVRSGRPIGRRTPAFTAGLRRQRSLPVPCRTRRATGCGRLLRTARSASWARRSREGASAPTRQRRPAALRSRALSA